MTVQTAIIPVAGIGTRAFPITTAIEKSMLPIYAGSYSRPLIDFMVDDCVKAGLKRIIFVTSERGKIQLTDYYGRLGASIDQQLVALGKTDTLKAELDRRLRYNLQFEYIIQPAGEYGTAIPLYLARDALKGEDRFIMMGGDDFVYHQDGTSELDLAMKTWASSNSNHVIMGAPVPRSSAAKYGVLQINNQGQLTAINEKPPLGRIPTHPVVNITRYLLSSIIWEALENEIKTKRGSGEHYITYAIADALADGQTFQIHPIKGKYLDGGSFQGLYEASEYISTHPPKN